MRTGDTTTSPEQFGLPDDRWKVRDFTPEEAAEVQAIHAGRLLAVYQGEPGRFGWEAPHPAQHTGG
ncbi:hypothetical protein [Streptomyces botrytidirepellens]|nr:hypothetical protein [Streptomyces botrytidirepellens]